MKTAIALLTLSALPFACLANDGYGPVGALHAPSSYRPPADLVRGGAFIDRILPIPVPHGVTSDTWGGDNVKPRNVENGLEDPAWSYWCSSVHTDANGLYQMFATRWSENDPRGHGAWRDSEVVRATSESPAGPFVVEQKIGPGHNVMCYPTKDGSHVLYVINNAYDIEVVRHPDGTKEGWHKLERPNVLQDKFGRATHLYLAAMDAPKDLDLGSDGHSSKVLALPLTVERRLKLVSGLDPESGDGPRSGHAARRAGL
jgi:hypothetical protein